MTQNNEREALRVKIARGSDSRLMLTQPDGKYFDVNDAIGKTFVEQTPISQNEQQEAVGEVVNERGYSEVFVDFFDKPPPPNGTKLYTSPPKQIPDGWKPLSNEQIAEVRESMITDGCLDTVEFANAIYTKLKHINAAPTTSLTSESNTEVGE